jgi:iron-sulfur cluster repair protein YtfE (RIC family)
MPRHSTFVPLSHDHHHALVLALRLRKGGPTTHKDEWPTDFLEHAKAALHFFEIELEPHFKKEEAAIFGGLPERLQNNPTLITLIAKLQEQHTKIRSLFGSVRKSIGTQAMDCLREELSLLGTLLDEHIRLEERQLFPILQAELTADELSQIALKMELT